MSDQNDKLDILMSQFLRGETPKPEWVMDLPLHIIGEKMVQLLKEEEPGELQATVLAGAYFGTYCGNPQWVDADDMIFIREMFLTNLPLPLTCPEECTLGLRSAIWAGIANGFIEEEDPFLDLDNE